MAGVDYNFVTTGFGNTDFGRFSNTIGGPGQITAINPPAPGVALPPSLVLMLASLGALGLTRPLRRAA